MKIVVGLGNPGPKYSQTRHNAGYEVLSCLASRYDVGRPKSKFNAEIAETAVRSNKTILISPLTFMNLSGQCVGPAVDFFKVPLNDVLIVCDDIQLDVGQLRFRAGGSAGGQNGLKDIIQRLGTDRIPRLRVGVGRVPPRWDTADYVLGKFDAKDREIMDVTIQRAADAVEMWIGDGIDAAMNRYNETIETKPKPPRPSKSDGEMPPNRTDGSTNHSKRNEI